GRHIRSKACLSFEVIPRRIDDRGGGLVRVNGRVRFVEGLAMPREEDEFRLSCYNSQTTWISIDRLLSLFGLLPDDLTGDCPDFRRDQFGALGVPAGENGTVPFDEAKVSAAVRRASM